MVRYCKHHSRIPLILTLADAEYLHNPNLVSRNKKLIRLGAPQHIKFGHVCGQVQITLQARNIMLTILKLIFPDKCSKYLIFYQHKHKKNY